LIRDVLLYGVFDGTGHVMLEQIQWRLSQWAAASTDTIDSMAFTTKYYVTDPRSLTNAARQRGRAPQVPLDQHFRALARVATACPLEPMAELAALLVQMTRVLRESEKRENDGAQRFAFASAYAMLETLCATAELGIADCRTALGIGAFECDSDERERLECAARFGIGWIGGRLVATLRSLWLGSEAGQAPEFDQWESALLREREHMANTMRIRLRKDLS
jgi:hypothetical protein